MAYGHLRHCRHCLSGGRPPEPPESGWRRICWRRGWGWGSEPTGKAETVGH